MSVTKFGELLKDQTEIPVSNFRPWVERGDRPHCWAGVKFKTLLTAKVEKPPGKGEKPEDENDSLGLQSIPSILGFHSPNPRVENEKERENKGIVEIECKRTVDGMDCAPELLVSDPAKKGQIVG